MKKAKAKTTKSPLKVKDLKAKKNPKGGAYEFYSPIKRPIPPAGSSGKVCF